MVIAAKLFLQAQTVRKLNMTLIKSISGIRGTLENIPGKSLSDYDIKQFTLAYSQEIISKESSSFVVIGRDARKSGKKISELVIDTLINEGYDILDIGLVTTPTLGISVKHNEAAGGIMISASHNDEKWNALKLLNNHGEFLTPDKVNSVIQEIERFPKKNGVGRLINYNNALKDHIELIISQGFLNFKLLKKKKLSVAVDGINSVGGIAIPEFLRKIGVENIKEINCKPNGEFAHNPEPLPENITEICNVIKKGKYDLGLVVDPDADRLCLVDENGEPFGEEYTLIAAADFIMKRSKNPVSCSNLSSSLGLKVLTQRYSGKYFSSPVGEINVVEKMKSVNAIIGGEGNGGVIYPKTHFGRDSLVGVAIILSLIIERDMTLSEIKKSLPEFHIIKSKMTFNKEMEKIIDYFKREYNDREINLSDGIRIDFNNSWVHIRKSNTEPVLRIISEANSKQKSIELSKKIISKLRLL